MQKHLCMHLIVGALWFIPDLELFSIVTLLIFCYISFSDPRAPSNLMSCCVWDGWVERRIVQYPQLSTVFPSAWVNFQFLLLTIRCCLVDTWYCQSYSFCPLIFQCGFNLHFPEHRWGWVSFSQRHECYFLSP